MIKFLSVDFSYGETVVFENLNLEIPNVGITAVIAPSGIGKTTLLRLIAGLETPQKGTITGVPRKIAYLFQEQRLLPWYSVLDNIRATCPNLSDDEIIALLLELGLSNEVVNKRPSELSGGQRQRVCLARAFAFSGDVLLLDEPFVGIDAVNRDKVLLKIREFAKSKPVILVSHIKEDVEVADHVVYL